MAPRLLTGGAKALPSVHHSSTVLSGLSAHLARPAAVYSARVSSQRRGVVTRWAKEAQQGSQPRAVTNSGQPADSAPNEKLNSMADVGSTAATANSAASRRPSAEGKRRIREQQRLLLQLLGTASAGSMSSLSSVDGMDLDSQQQHGQQQQQQQHRQPQNVVASKATAANPSVSDSVQPAAARTLSKSGRQPAGLYDDDSAADYDPVMLDMLGFTSVAQYLQYKLDSAIKQAKIDSIGAALWGILAFGVLSDMGGHAQYMHYIRELTLNGTASDNLGFLWVYILGYFTVKSCFMSFATGWRAMTARKAEAGRVEELEKLETQHQRLGYWQLQEQLERMDNRANRTFTELAMASMLLGILIFMRGGLDNLSLQMDTVDQQALCGLLVMMWLFWETYFASIGAMVQLVAVATHFIEKWQHKQKWETDNKK